MGHHSVVSRELPHNTTCLFGRTEACWISHSKERATRIPFWNQWAPKLREIEVTIAVWSMSAVPPIHTIFRLYCFAMILTGPGTVDIHAAHFGSPTVGNIGPPFPRIPFGCVRNCLGLSGSSRSRRWRRRSVCIVARRCVTINDYRQIVTATT